MAESTAARGDYSYVDRDGVTIHYYGWRAAAPKGIVQIVHGVGEYALRYEELAQALVAGGYSVNVGDLRGHGQSEAPHAPSAYPDDVLARDLAALVDHLGLTDYDLCGFSLGARTSVRGVIAGLRPKRLVLGGMGLEGLAGWTGRGAFFIDAIDRFDSVKAGDPAFPAVSFMKSMKVDRVAARLLLQTFADTPPEALAAITMPTLIVNGDQDRDNGDPAALTAALPDAVQVIVPGTHMSCVTKPDLSEAIRGFLTS